MTGTMNLQRFIDWRLTPTLSIFQPYHGVSKYLMIGGNELFGLLVLGTNSSYYWIEYLLRSLKVMKWDM